jgi:hypoxanthine phosphoribosyltransferase
MNPDILDRRSYSGVITVGENGVIDGDASPDDLRTYTERLKRDRRIKSVLIPKDCLDKRISAMADEIAKDYPQDRVLHVMVVLTGSIFFAADLGRELYDRAGINARFHLIKTSVYDDTIKKSGEHYRAVKLELEPKDIEGKDILVVEDITDQGFTLTWLKNYFLSERKVSSVRICSLLDKELQRPSEEVRKIREQLLVDYTGFKIPDVWVAGYGVDAAQELRNLPCIVSIDESLYK